MLGKQKCKILREIRQKIADENDIPYVTRECTYQGECRGTCPKCEAELRYLEQQLQQRQSLGKRVAVAALCTGLAFSSAGCAPVDAVKDIFRSRPDDVAGLIEKATPSPEVYVTEGEVAWPEDEPLEGEEEWELEGDVSVDPDPASADANGND